VEDRGTVGAVHAPGDNHQWAVGAIQQCFRDTAEQHPAQRAVAALADDQESQCAGVLGQRLVGLAVDHQRFRVRLHREGVDRVEQA